LDILYVHPAKQEVDARYDKFISSPPYPIVPVGIIGLMNMLRSCGWAVQGLNLPLELILRPAFHLQRWLRDQSPPVLAMVDLHWYEHSYGAIEVARAIKAVWPHVSLVLGGLTASCFAVEIMNQFPEVDYIICGDAEEPLKLLAEGCCGDGPTDPGQIPNLVFRHPDQVQRNRLSYTAAPGDLDRLDFVSMDWLVHWRNYAALQYSGAGKVEAHEPRLRGHWLAVGRGCVYNCPYCGGCKKAHRKLARRNAFVLRSPGRVAQEVRTLQDQGFHQVSFSLDLASFEPAWWQAFFAQLRESKVRIGLYNEFYQLPSDEFLQEFLSVAELAHTEVAISPLSGDEHVRRRNGKFYSNTRLLRALETLKQYRIPIFVYFSLNLPGETPRAFGRTLELAGQIGQRYPPELLRMLNTCHTLDPASPMSENPGPFGVQVRYRTFQDYYTYCQGTGWQPRMVIRGQHRGFDMTGRPPEVIEQMARQWDDFAKRQPFHCAPVPRGW
jgi:hypothetical protein